MDRAIKIIEREIQIRLSANENKKNLRYQLIKIEIESLIKALHKLKN